MLVTGHPMSPVERERRDIDRLRYGSASKASRREMQKRLVARRAVSGNAGTQRTATTSAGMVPAPAPVPLSRLWPLDVLLKRRNELAREVARLSAAAAPAPASRRVQPARPEDDEPPW